MPPAAAGMQTVQLVQMRALKQMIKDSTDAFMQRYTQRQQRRQQGQRGQQQGQEQQQQSDYESDLEDSDSRRGGRYSAFQSSASQLPSEQVCDARTVFMPRADDLEQFLDFVAQAAAQQMQQGEEGEAEGEMQPDEMQQEQQPQQPQSEMDWQTERMQPQPQQGEEEWQSERMQPEGEEAVQSSRIARLRRQLSDADIAAMCAQWRRDQSSKLGKSQLSSSFAMQKPKSMQLRQSMKVKTAKLKAMKLKLQHSPSQLKMRRSRSGRPCPTDASSSSANLQQQSLLASQQPQGSAASASSSAYSEECPEPPYTPGEAASSFPESTYEEGEGEQQQQQGEFGEESDVEQGGQWGAQGRRQQQGEGGESESESGSEFGDIPQLRVQPFRVSLFMQRLLNADIANAMQPFAAVTADMPVHLIGPSLLVDPAFVAKGQRGGEGQQGEQQQQQPQQQPQQQQQQPIQSSASSTFGAPFSVQPQQQLKLSGQQMKWQGQGLGSAMDSSSAIEIDPSDIDTQLDVKIAKAFGVTPADIAAPFEGGARSQFSVTGQRPQSVHYEKEEGGSQDQGQREKGELS